MKDILELQEFFVEGKSQEKSHVLLHITEPSTPKEQERGYFFAVAEIVDGSIEQIEHLQQMIDDLESGFYETEDEEEKSAFEITLEYINKRGHHILQEKESKIHCLVGAIREGNISFAYHGRPTAIVFYKGKTFYESMSVIEEEEKGGKDQLFSALMQGNVQVGDYFYVATPHVENYISTDRLQKIITVRPMNDSVEHIQKVLAGLRSDESFGGILFHLTTKEQLPKTGKMPAHLKQDPAGSLTQMMHTQQSTDETLHPPLLSKATESLKSYWAKKQQGREENDNQNQRLAKGKRTETPPTAEKNPAREGETNYRPRTDAPVKKSLVNIILIGLGKGLVMAAQIIIIIIQRLALLLKNIIVGLFLLITNQGGQREYIINKMKASTQRRWQSITSMPLASKILFLATIVFTLFFIGSIVFLKAKEAREAREQAYTNLVQEIVDKKDTASAGLIYGDDAKAFALLKEAKNLIAQLPQKSKEQKTKVEELTENVESELIKLRKIETVSPEIIADLTQTNSAVNTEQLTAIGDQLISYGPKDTNLYIINQNTKSVQTQSNTNITGLIKASTPKENDFTVFLTDNNSIAEMNKDSFTLSAKDISFANSGTKLSDIFIYNRRAYTLDPATNQIYKHNPTQTGYDRGTPWIKTVGVNLAGAVSLAIDGDMFVLKQSGELLKFDTGEQKEFTIAGLDPALQNPTVMWTYNGVNNIYILEPTNKRMIVIDKEGKLVKQYTAVEWQNPTGMVVDEAGGKAFVLDGNKVYKFSL